MFSKDDFKDDFKCGLINSLFKSTFKSLWPKVWWPSNQHQSLISFLFCAKHAIIMSRVEPRSDKLELLFCSSGLQLEVYCRNKSLFRFREELHRNEIFRFVRRPIKTGSSSANVGRSNPSGTKRT